MLAVGFACVLVFVVVCCVVVSWLLFGVCCVLSLIVASMCVLCVGG